MTSGNFLALTGDTTLTWSSPVLPKLYTNNTEDNPLGRIITETEESWIGSALYIGATLGMIPFCLLADRIGRRPVLISIALPHIIAYLTLAFAKTIKLYYFARILGGMSLGANYVVLPMYVGEICEDSYRGMLLASYSTFASFGDLLPYLIGPYLSAVPYNLILFAFPLIFLICFISLAPESPYFHIKHNNYDQAKNCLRKLRSVHEIDEEMEKIIKETQQNDDGDDEPFLSKGVVKGFIIALFLSSFQQLSGLGPFLAYTQSIFEEAGSNISSDISSIIVGIVLFVASFFGPLIVDRKGRKFLLICSASGVLISEIFLGLYFYVKDHYSPDLSHFTWVPIACMIIFMLTFNIGYGPLPPTVTSEILPSRVKFYLATITGSFGWIVSFLVTKFFVDLNHTLGRGETLWFFAAFSVLALLFVGFFMPETKGKSFREIQEILSK